MEGGDVSSILCDSLFRPSPPPGPVGIAETGPARASGALHALIQSAERNDRLALAADWTLSRLRPWLKHGRRAELLNGTWLGHSAHPFFTDFPEGAWMAASFLDLFGPEGSERSSQRLVGFGLLAAVPTFLSGMADWGKAEGPARQSGLVHGATSSVSTLLYAASYVARRKEKQVPAVAIGVVAGLVATLDGWIGGHLSLARGVGVSTDAFDEAPEDWTATSIQAEAVAEGRPLRGTVRTMEIAVARRGETFYALSGRCSFDGAPLGEGALWDDTLVCPRNGCSFHLEDGRVIAGPASVPQSRLDVRAQDGRIEVRRPPNLQVRLR